MKNLIWNFLFLTILSCNEHHIGKDGDDKKADVGQSKNTSQEGVALREECSLKIMGPAIADGATMTKVKVTLRDRFKKPVINSKVALIVSGNANEVESCSLTDKNGVAYCYISSHYAERKIVQLLKPVEIGIPIDFYESSSNFLVGEITTASTADVYSTMMFANTGSYYDNTLIQDSSSRWMMTSMHTILGKGYQP